MKKIYVFALLLFILNSCENNKNKYEIPIPTNGDTFVKEDMEDESKRNAKKEWLKKLFRTPEGMDAQYIEYQNSYAKFLKRNKTIRSRTPEETFADGLITAEWKERGSSNQSGSVFVTEFDQDSKDVYLISAGGHLWKGGMDGVSWEVINQNARFHENFLDQVINENGSKRLLAAISNKPHYSDDEGKTWTASTGFEPLGNARLKSIFTTNDSLQYTYFIGQENSNQNLILYQTIDKGISYKKLATFLTSNRKNLCLTISKNNNEIYVLEQLSSSSSRLHKMNADQTKLELIEAFSPISYDQGDGNIVSTYKDGITYLYMLSKSGGVTSLKLSTDEGKTWEDRGVLATEPWGVGLFVSSEDPNFLMYGDIECYRTFDGGASWAKINGWGEYYGNVLNKLHADMMYFNDFVEKETGKYFMLISNHGGLSRMDEFDGNAKNISLKGLNVSQYYSVKTEPITEEWIYAGSQDQGFQRAKEKKGEILDFNQAISGDYGHIVFSQNKNLWTVYPGGWVSYWPNPKNGGIEMSYELESSDESVWIPPLVSDPNYPINEIFLAGGNINGGSGSHLIKLTALDVIHLFQYDYDFKANSGGTISAINIADDEQETIYVATDNGKFFYSHDYGDTFTKSVNVNGGHYLYGSVIISSKMNSDLIYTAGTGYNGIPVMRSLDKGKTFSPFGDGLPNTTVLGMVMNKDESLLFAATTSGPYVCILSEEKWYDITGEAAPDVTYWSVELVNNDNTVRFGTYGRGIWDFEITNFVVSNEETPVQKIELAYAYPNPITDYFTIVWPKANISQADIYSLEGKKVLTLDPQKSVQQYSLGNLPSGRYIIRYALNNKIQTTSIIKL